MTAKISALPEEVVRLMAAGEVIDSLAAAVRELAENALDAGATRIVITLCPEQWWLRVADNGCGMELSDLQWAAAPHSTSKISESQDLQGIKTLGFRGEALHSLARLAQLEIASRPSRSPAAQRDSLGSPAFPSNSDDMGWCGRYNTDGTCLELQPTAIAPGTIITVQHLFGTWIPRRQALPPLPQQLRTIQHTIHHLALCHPQVTWQVHQVDARFSQERPWFHIASGATAQQILPQILRQVQGGDLQELTVNLAELKTPNAQVDARLYLLLGLPDRCHRRRPDWVKVALNGRCVQVPELEQTILAGFRRTLPRDRFPLCFVHLQLPPEQIDWNRHPAKSDIYLHNLEFWRTQVAAAIAQAFQQHPTHLPESLYSSRVSTLIKTAESEGGYSVRREISPTDPLDVQPASSDRADPAETFSSVSRLTAIAQVHNTYILAETPSGLCLIEQHIAHERVLYEQLCDRWAIVPLALPITLPHLSEAQVEQLQRLGLGVDPFGEEVWVVRSAPELIAQRDDCAEALLELSLGGDLQTGQVAIACRTAIRNGTPLSLPEMQSLLDQWQRSRNPRTCPHGRPICLTLEESSLSRFFRRHWVIGKSHGI